MSVRPLAGLALLVPLLGGGLTRALAEEPGGARAGSALAEEEGALRVEIVGLPW